MAAVAISGASDRRYRLTLLSLPHALMRIT